MPAMLLAAMLPRLWIRSRPLTALGQSVCRALTRVAVPLRRIASPHSGLFANSSSGSGRGQAPDGDGAGDFVAGDEHRLAGGGGGGGGGKPPLGLGVGDRRVV